MSVTIKYKGNTIASASTDTTKTIKTSGKYCEDDIEVINTQDGGITPSGSQTFTENGTYDVTAIAEAIINVSGGGGLPNVRKFTVNTDATLGANGGIIVPVVTSGRAIYVLKANAGTAYRPYYCGILSVDYSQGTKAHHVAVRYDNTTNVADSSPTITNGEVKIVGGATWQMQENYTVDVYEVII